MYKQESLSVDRGSLVFLNSELLEKILAWASTNKSTMQETSLRIFYQSAVFSIIAIPIIIVRACSYGLECTESSTVRLLLQIIRDH